MHAFVTGAKGFVARHLIARLAGEGWRVTGIDLEVDVTDAAAIAAAVDRAQPDAIVHLAAQASVAASRRDPSGTHRVNYLGTLSVLRAALRCASRPRVVVVGTCDQYGTTTSGETRFTEDSPMRPQSAYGRSKVEADELAAAYGSAGLEVVRVRAFNHTGPGQTDAYVLSSFARQVAEIERGRSEPVLHVGNLESVRDISDVRDVVDGYVRLLDRDVEPTAYNVAGGVGRSIRELLDALLEFATRQPDIEIDPERFRPTDYSVGDYSRLHAATGWSPRIPIGRTLKDLLEDWRSRLSAP